MEHLLVDTLLVTTIPLAPKKVLYRYISIELCDCVCYT